MRSFISATLLLFGLIGFVQPAISSGVDPDLIDPEMVNVMYLISPNDLQANSYSNGYPSSFNIKLCEACSIKSYSLAANSEILFNAQPLLLKDLTISLLKKNFDVIQLGINRKDKTITYLYLGGISELSAEELKQEKPNEY